MRKIIHIVRKNNNVRDRLLDVVRNEPFWISVMLYHRIWTRAQPADSNYKYNNFLIYVVRKTIYIVRYSEKNIHIVRKSETVRFVSD